MCRPRSDGFCACHRDAPDPPRSAWAVVWYVLLVAASVVLVGACEAIGVRLKP